MAYEIWLSWNNQQEGFQLPVMPGTIEVSSGGKSKTYDVVGLGEINVIKDRHLTEYTFSSFFPSLGNRVTGGEVSGIGYDPFVAIDQPLEPKQYIDYILKWMASKKPIRFVFVGDISGPGINIPVSIEKFDWKEVAGSSGDIEYNIYLKQYVFYAAQKVTISESNGQVQLQKDSPARHDDRQPPKTYTIVSGDTLWIVAKKTLGDGGRWKEIQKLNALSDAQVKALPVGRTLKIPGVA